MRVIEILSSRREYTKINPLVVLLGKGDHQITSTWTNQYGNEIVTTLVITRSNVTFVGTGKDTTTISGGFAIRLEQNITFKKMTVTNTSEDGNGIYMSDAKVELVDVALKGCDSCALYIPRSTSVTTVVATRCEFANSRNGAYVEGSSISATFKNCVFNDNRMHGIQGEDNAIIHLHGEATAIHSNEGDGIYACNSSKVLIHIPSHHNTSYDNREEDRRAWGGGTITNVED